MLSGSIGVVRSAGEMMGEPGVCTSSSMGSGRRGGRAKAAACMW